VEISIGSADRPPAQPGEHLSAREPYETEHVLAQATETLGAIRQFAGTLNGVVERMDKGGTVDQIGRLATSLGRLSERLERGGALDDVGAAAKSMRRIAEQVEQGKGLLHAVIYDEPETLRQLNALLRSTQEIIARAQSGDNAVSVLLSPESAKAARSLLAAMEALGRGAEKPGAGEGVLSALLFDPAYRTMADDLKAVAQNFRDVSERVAHGQGLLGELVYGGNDTPLGRASVDVQVAMANLRAVSERLKSGDGTLGALIEDPTVYENLAAFLEGAHRSFLLRALMKSALGSGGAPPSGTKK
jgi:phospholipid/cholesterol/gamma-HCH transport system substrate-binding protein